MKVCLIRWEEDELHVEDEIDQLYHIFDELYGFNTEIWLIPSSASQIQLTRATCDFLQKFDAEGNLFIAYQEAMVRSTMLDKINGGASRIRALPLLIGRLFKLFSGQRHLMY